MQDQLAVRGVVTYCDRLLSGGDFTACDELLRRIDVRRITPAVMVALLGMTKPAKEDLPARPGLYARIREAIVKQRGVVRADKLLTKYQ